MTTSAQSTVPLAGGGAMPLLGFGTWQTHGEETYTAVRAALDIGYRHLDTATMYENEVEVGRALRDSGVAREDVFITTKMPPERAHDPRGTLEASLRDLGVDRVDLWLVHWPPNKGASPETWQAFIDAHADGLTADIGVSNYSLDQIDELIAATGRAPAVNQIKWSPFRYDAAIVAGHRDRSVVVEGYSPFRSADLGNATLVGIADDLHRTPAQVILRWHLQHEIVVIPKSSHAERVAANFDVYDFELSAADMAALDALGGAR